jgi:hypothetical protein
MLNALTGSPVRGSIGEAGAPSVPVVNEPPTTLLGVVTGLADGSTDAVPTRGSVGCGVDERGPLRGSFGGVVVRGPIRGSFGGAVVRGPMRGSVGGADIDGDWRGSLEGAAGGRVLVVGRPGTGGPVSTEGVRGGGGAVVGFPT